MARVSLALALASLALLVLCPNEASAQLREVFRDENAVISFNKTMDIKKATWLTSLYSKGWAHIQKNLGPFKWNSDGGRLQGQFGSDSEEGSMGGYKDVKQSLIGMSVSPSSIREGNLYDKNGQGSTQPKQRDLFEAQLNDIVELVETSNNGIIGSPARDIWREEGFPPIMVYDMFLNMGSAYKTEAENWKRTKSREAHDSATTKIRVFWLRDWWLPLYDKYGKTKFLDNYFKLVAKYWPKEKKAYKGDMNVGEFVHFFSGAAGVNLQSHAQKAIGWDEDDAENFSKAQKDYADIKYKN